MSFMTDCSSLSVAVTILSFSMPPATLTSIRLEISLSRVDLHRMKTEELGIKFPLELKRGGKPLHPPTASHTLFFVWAIPTKKIQLKADGLGRHNRGHSNRGSLMRYRQWGRQGPLQDCPPLTLLGRSGGPPYHTLKSTTSNPPRNTKQQLTNRKKLNNTGDQGSANSTPLGNKENVAPQQRRTRNLSFFHWMIDQQLDGSTWLVIQKH